MNLTSSLLVLVLNLDLMFALVDCNNFYASCERVFNPKLKGKPIVVLSNNDGCVIARSQEAKDIGVPMAAPAFKYKDLFSRYNVNIFSANFTLYGDMSHRVMKILSEYVPEMEIYSIDEAFLSLDLKYHNLTAYCTEIRERILKSTGIPVSIGIGPTKTLAKICSHLAKKASGVFNWNEVADKDKLLSATPVGEIWGIGWKTAPKLNSHGIYSALQLKNCNSMWLRKMFSITILRTQTELKETPCLLLENVHAPRKNIMSSKSFGKRVTSLEELREAVATYTSRGCEKLIEQKSAASHIYVSIKTNKHNPNLPYYFNYRIMSLNSHSWYVPDFINAAFRGLDEIYKEGYFYKKATIMLLGIVPQAQIQFNLFQDNEHIDKTYKINKAVSRINYEFGGEFIKYAATGMNQNWRMKKEKCSKRFTTKWEELLTIKI